MALGRVQVDRINQAPLPAATYLPKCRALRAHIYTAGETPAVPGGLEFGFEELVDLLGVGFAAALLHDLADEEAEEAVFA